MMAPAKIDRTTVFTTSGVSQNGEYALSFVCRALAMGA